MFTTPHLDSHSTTDPKLEILSAVLTGNRISHVQRNVRSIMHVHVCRKYDIFRQRRLNDSEVGGEIAFRGVYPARAYSTVVVLVLIEDKLLGVLKDKTQPRISRIFSSIDRRSSREAILDFEGGSLVKHLEKDI